MRLAATLTPMRDAARQPVSLRGTLRDSDFSPHEVTILDLSASGFLAELPGDVRLAPGERVRIAATTLGVHEAVMVRIDEGGHGFAFVRAIGDAALAAAEGEQPSSVAAFPLGEAQRLPAPAAGEAPAAAADAADAPPRLSARASLALVTGLSAGLWGLLAAALWVAYPFG